MEENALCLIKKSLKTYSHCVVICGASFTIAMDRAVKVASLVLVEIVSCSIVGLTYMDSLNLVPSKPPLRGEDPCNPLYWYPRQIPDYCYFPKSPTSPPALPKPAPPPASFPIPSPPISPPIPLPMPLPMPMPMFIPLPPPAVPLPVPGIVPVPAFGAPAPLGPPVYPPLLPGSMPYPIPAIQSGLVPGVDGLVSSDGAINILPFSDAYSDLLEKHKQKMIRRRLQNLLDEYEHYPKKRSHRRHHCMDSE